MNQLINQAPTHLTGNRRTVGAASVQGMGMAPVPYISIEGQKFTLVDATGVEFQWQAYGALPVVTPQGQQLNGPYLDAVVIDINEHMSKVYYESTYSPNAQKFLPPDCWSDNGVAPSASASKPQSPTCEHCPHHRWGSRINQLGNEVRACDDVKKMAFYIPELGRDMVFLLRLKGSSHKNWRSYYDKVRQNSVGDRPADPVDVVTRIYFVPDQIGILNFDAVSFIDAGTAAVQDKLWAAKATDAMVGRLDRPRTAALPQGGQGAVQVTHQPSPGLQPSMQPNIQVQTHPAPQNTRPAALPAGFGGAPANPTQPAGGPPAGFGGSPAVEPTTTHANHPATASPSNGAMTQDPPSGRPARNRGGRPRASAGAPQTQPTPPQGFGSGGAAQQPHSQTGGEVQGHAGNPPPPPQNFGVQQGAPLNTDLENALTKAITRN